MINVVEFGAVGDGVTNDTNIIQEAIDSLKNGGSILFPAGYTFIVSNLQLKGNIHYILEGNSCLKASSSYENYEKKTNIDEYAGEPMYTMIYAEHCDNIKISGTGTIDGNGMKFVSRKDRYIYVLDRYPRITMLFFENINNLVLKEITITNGCYWTIHPVGCNNIKFLNLNILQDLMMPNCDGIDPDHCQNVVIADCIIESADDCIVLKNTKYFEKYGPTSNVTVTNCILKSTSAAFKIGTESFGDFNNIVFSNSIIKDSNRGVSLQLRDGGNVNKFYATNLLMSTRKFDDIWWGKGEPIAITTYQRNPGKSMLSTIKNISISNCFIEGENSIYMSAQEYGAICDIKLKDIVFNLEQKSKWTIHKYDNRPFGAEHSGLFDDELVGIYTNNINNFELSNFDFISNKNIKARNE